MLAHTNEPHIVYVNPSAQCERKYSLEKSRKHMLTLTNCNCGQDRWLQRCSPHDTIAKNDHIIHYLMTAKPQTIHRALNLQNRKERFLKNLKKQTRLGCHFSLLSKQNNALSPVSVVNCETLSPICRSNYSQSFTGIMSND